MHSQPDSSPRDTLNALAPIMVVVFVGYLIIGIPLPVLPLHVHHNLGLSPLIVGLVAGSQFAAALVSRMWAGHLADSRGAKPAVIIGLLVGSTSGVLYVVSLGVANPMGAATVLMGARALLGVAESIIITGALSWGMGLAGPKRTGTVIAWVGTALFAALAAGAPIGSLLYERQGFFLVGVVTMALPLAALLVVLPMRRPEVHGSASRPSFASVLRAVWLPGVAVAIAGTAFSSVTTFAALLYAERGWEPVWLGVTAFSLALIVGRAAFGGLPDKLGGARVAVACVLVQAIGLASVGLAGGSGLALLGVTLTGLGYSLVYPGLGVEAMRQASAATRGVVMGAYTAFLDVSLGLGNPLLGAIADRWSLSAVFLASAIAAVVAGATTLLLFRRRPSA